MTSSIPTPREICDAATPRPWTAATEPSNNGTVSVFGGETGFPVAITSAVWNRDKALELADARYIALACNEYPAALDRIALLEAQVADLSSTLADCDEQISARETANDVLMAAGGMLKESIALLERLLGEACELGQSCAEDAREYGTPTDRFDEIKREAGIP